MVIRRLSNSMADALGSRHSGVEGAIEASRSRWTSVVIPLAIYACFSAISALFLCVGASRQAAVLGDQPGYHSTAPMPASPGYWGVLSNWDGQWYRSIAEHGYPNQVPLEGGAAAQSELAFLPLYPLSVRVLMALTSLPFNICAWALSLALGAVAVIIIYRLALPRIGAFHAGALIACLCAYPTSAVFQVAYTESMALCLLALALAALCRRRYGWFLVVAIGLALTRPIVLPLAFVVAVHGYIRARSEGPDFRWRARCLVAAVAVATASLSGLWPLVVSVLTGDGKAFLQTQAAWPTNQRAQGAGWFGAILSGGPVGTVALVGLLLVTLLAVRRAASIWGPELRTWGLVYPLYLLAATRPGPSIFRYLLLAITPLWPFVPASMSRYSRMAVLARWNLLAFMILALL